MQTSELQVVPRDIPSTKEEKFNELIRFGIELNEVRDVDILLERILYRARRFLHADAGSIMIRERDNLSFVHSQNDTLQSKLPEGEKLAYQLFRIRISRSSIAGYVALTGRILNIEDAYDIPQSVPYRFNHAYDDLTNYRTVSVLAVPLATMKNEIIGVMELINAKDEEGNIVPFNRDDDRYILNFANNASMILQRALMTRALILRMISMAELRDPMETAPHVNRVGAYSIELYERWARKRKINKNEIEKNKDILRLAAMLHDVGKVAISDLILKKPAKITRQEYEIMKQHTILGAMLFKMKQSDIDEMSAIVALNHHENWDGTGYPGHVNPETGLPTRVDENNNPVPKKGEEIPIFGRIVALADVFDALSTKRVYKEAWAREDVITEIKRLRGKKFDPELVDIFIESLPAFEAIQAEYKQ
jgi:HD-GYP domain-containing protein (c-di-GMP phosphodiesterase class II)